MTTSKNYQKITVSGLQELQTDDTEFVLLDVLPPDHFAAVHLPAAKNACVFFVSFLEDLAALAQDKSQKVVVYGSSELSHDARSAAEKMIREGFDDVLVLEGGIKAWREAGCALAGDSPDVEQPRQTLVDLVDGAYSVDPSESSIQWAGRNISTTHFGTVDVTQGTITIVQGRISGSVEIDMESIHNSNLEGDELQQVLEDHLRSDDFFFTSHFPKAVLLLKEAVIEDPGYQTRPNARIFTELTLKGNTELLEFDAVLNCSEEGTVSIEAHFDIDRTRWGIIYGSSRYFEHLGMHKVFDLISIQLRIVAHRS